MGTLLQLKKRLEALKVDRVSQDSMEAVSNQLADRQRDQMLEGKNRKGARIGRYRNPAYARMKEVMNPLPGFGVPDLRLTGEFYKQVYVDVRDNTVIIDSTDEKTQSLVNKYGEEIFGLNENTKAEFIRKDLRPVFMQKISEATGLPLSKVG